MEMLSSHEMTFGIGPAEPRRVRIDLLLHVAGQEAEPLPRLDRRAGQHDALHPPCRQHGDCLGHCEIGLASTGRADAERHLVAGQHLHIRRLTRRARPDRATPGSDRRQIG
jgi:hypothetical protein